jgi:uncharacterized membrane protein YfhO
MIYLSLLIAAMLLTAIIIVIAIVFRYQKNPVMQKVIAIGLILSVLLGAGAAIYGTCVRSSIDDLTATYKDLILYKSTVENSMNEYIRYDYYEKVNEYNERYSHIQEGAESPWFSVLYPRNWDSEAEVIIFQLHGDHYGD